MKTLSITVLLCLLSTGVAAKAYDAEITVIRSPATVVSQIIPAYDDRNVRGGQEGWVRLAFVVTADGSVADPIVLDAVGGPSFERAAMAASQNWTFAPGDAEIPLNIVDIRFTLSRGRDDASRDFVRRYRRMMVNITNDKLEDGREQFEDAVEYGGWNLYEQTMLQLVSGLIAARDEDDTAKLDSFWRAINIGDRNALDSKNRLDTLRQIFELEHKRGQYAHAAVTRSIIASTRESAATVQGLVTQSQQIDEAFMTSPLLVASGEIRKRSVPHWSYVPQRGEIGFAEIDGTLTRMDVRCAKGRLRVEIVAGERYELPQEGGECRVFVFGEPGSRFQFVEFADDVDNEEAATQVAANEF